VISRNLEKARAAYKNKDIELTKSTYSKKRPEQHMQEHGQLSKAYYTEDWTE